MEPQRNATIVDARRIAGALLALLLLLGSMPLATGVVVVVGPAHPELAMNFCHPLESATAAAPILLARPALTVIRPRFIVFERLRFPARAPLCEFSLEPESPPPESAI